MEDCAVSFERVWKSYPSYHRLSGGVKSVLFHPLQTIGELRSRRTALEDVSFAIKRGECFGFIGRNGAGKSTTLGLIAGVLSPDSGTVQVNGRISPLLELGAGFHPELTGRENILLNGVLMGLTRQEVLELEEEIVAFSELGEFIDQPVRIYSSGMYGKLGFSVVTILKPEILLIDEVLAVGDMAFAQKCETTFEKFRSNPDVTIILVSHSLASVKKLCDRAAWVEDKTVNMLGEAKEVVKAYEEKYTPTAAVKQSVRKAVRRRVVRPRFAACGRHAAAAPRAGRQTPAASTHSGTSV
jgi:lipopolysaccharide transport system ATP-binding protein